MLADVSRLVVTASGIASASITLDTVAKWAEIFGGAAALVALPFIAWQIVAAKSIARADRTASVKAEWLTEEFGERASAATAFLDVVDTHQCIAKIKSWSSMTTSQRRGVYRQLSFFESLCQSYNVNEIDRSTVAETMGPTLLVEFLRASWFVYWVRADTQDDFVFSEWEMALRDLRRKRPRWSRRRRWVYSSLRAVPTEFRIRAICVPPGGASDAEWLHAARLSMALAEQTALGELAVRAAKEIAPKVPSPGQIGWAIALLPRSLDDSPQQCEWNSGLARAIKAQVDGMSPEQLADFIVQLESHQPVLEALRRGRGS